MPTSNHRKQVAISAIRCANITEYYRVMREAARHEFREDNDVTLDTFLRECHDEANNRSEPTARTAS